MRKKFKRRRFRVLLFRVHGATVRFEDSHGEPCEKHYMGSIGEGPTCPTAC